MSYNTLNFIYDGAETSRYHTWPVLRRQNIGDHSYKVAMLCAYLVGDCEPGIGANLLMAALVHDLAEHKMGDLPSPVKRELPDMIDGKSGVQKPFHEVWDGMEQFLLAGVSLDWDHTLSPAEARVLKMADAADGCLYCVRERAMGNKLIDPVFVNFNTYFFSLCDYTRDPERILGQFITTGWQDAIR